MKRKILVPFVLLNIIALTSCTLINDNSGDDSFFSSEEESIERSESESSDIVIEESESIEESSEESSESESEEESESESEEESSESEIIKDNMSFGEETGNVISSPNKWYYWADNNWEGSKVNVLEAYVERESGLAYVDYEIEFGNCNYGLQLFYRNSNLENNKGYTLVFYIKSTVTMDINVNHVMSVNINNSWKKVTCPYVQASNSASIALIFATSYGGSQISIKDYTWEEVEEDPDEPTDEVIYPDGYSTLFFSDEFNSTSLNTSHWGFDLGTGYNGWGNSEIQTYTDKNHKVGDGVLTITAKKEGTKYTSTRLVSRDHIYHTYGYIEARIALPLGTGLWPAFWMMPQTNEYGGWPRSGEIDIMEARGRIPYVSSSALHYTGTEENSHDYSSSEYNHVTPISKYHRYAVEWTEDTITFYVDGNLNYSVNKNSWRTYADFSNTRAPFDKDFYIILNLALGGQFDNYQNPSDSDLPAEMKVDYVRWFTK